MHAHLRQVHLRCGCGSIRLGRRRRRVESDRMASWIVSYFATKHLSGHYRYELSILMPYPASEMFFFVLSSDPRAIIDLGQTHRTTKYARAHLCHSGSELILRSSSPIIDYPLQNGQVSLF